MSNLAQDQTQATTTLPVGEPARPLARAWGPWLVVIALAFGGYLRLSDVGEHGFWTDELFHVFAARSFVSDGSLTVPYRSTPYTRALPITMITAASFKVLGESETSARLVFALINLGFIALAYPFIARLFSPMVAVIACASMALSVMTVHLAKECRMYTLHQLLFFLLAIACWWWLERSGRSLRLMVVIVLLTLGVASVQPLGLMLALPLTLYSATMLAVTPRSHPRKFKYLLMLSLVAIAGVVGVAMFAAEAWHWLTFATRIPAWNRFSESHFTYYFNVLSHSHPIILAMFPIGAVIAIKRYGRIGFYCLLVFASVFVLHAFVFGRRSDRYIFHLLPFFIVVGSVGAEFVVTALWPALKDSTARWLPWQRWSLIAAGCVTAVMVLAPRLTQVVEDSAIPYFPDWKNLDPAVHRTVAGTTVVSTERLVFDYYFGRQPNYIIDASYPPGDDNSMILRDAASFRSALEAHPDLSVVTHSQHLDSDAFVAPDVRDLITGDMQRVDFETDDFHLMVFVSRPRR